MKCTLCKLLPNEHSFKVCKMNTCDCSCVIRYLNQSKNRNENRMRQDTPEWLNLGVKELKSIKIPKVYSDYMYMLWNVSRGKEFSAGHPPAYCKSLKNKNTVRIATK